MSLSVLTLLALSTFGGNRPDETSWPRMLVDQEPQDPSPQPVPDPGPPAADGQQKPPPTPPPPPPAPPPGPKNPEYDGPPSPVTFSLNGRIPFPLGSARIGTFNGTTTLGQRVKYDDLFRTSGWGGAAEVAFLSSDWEDEDLRAAKDPNYDRRDLPRAVDRHSLGFYAALQFDRFGGDTVNLGGGQSLHADRVNVETAFVGFKDHHPWGRGVFTEVRVGGGVIHYGPTRATYTTGGTTSNVELFKGTWGPAAEVALRFGVNLGGSVTLFAGGEAYAAQGPREGEGLPFTVNSNTFYAAAAEAGIEFGF